MTLGNVDANLVNAFATALRDDALRVVSVLPDAMNPAGDFSVVIGGGTIWIPHRIYHDPAQIEFDRLTQTQAVLLACLLTRHHSGFVRAEYLARILYRDDEWIPPFVVQLVGEYVVEIVKLIRDNLRSLNPETYRHFLIRNAAFYRMKTSRVQSYWDCYYRSEDQEEYAGFQVVKYFDQLIEDQTPQ
ncbi:MAG TPA: hypothetical protein VFC37_00120 [Terracidiphilus sp.]|nr:hypothetical protein [Terracidiphilus sp.]